MQTFNLTNITIVSDDETDTVFVNGADEPCLWCFICSENEIKVKSNMSFSDDYLKSAFSNYITWKKST